METSVLDHVSTVSCQFESVADGTGPAKTCEVALEFAELQGASDPVLIGFPQLLQWGVRFEEDADGNPWVELTKLGVTLLAERRGHVSASLGLTPSVSVNVVGPAILNIPFQVWAAERHSVGEEGLWTCMV